MGLKKTSGYRSPEESKRVGGYETDDHTKGTASDFAGSVKDMDAYANWAINSGLFSKVIYKGKNLLTGTKVDGHYDHVHVTWKG